MTSFDDMIFNAYFKATGGEEKLIKLFRDIHYWGIDYVKHDKDGNNVVIYFKVPKDSQLLEEYEGVCTTMAGETAAKILKSRIMDYFGSSTSFNIKVRFKIDNNKDPWTLEQADTALKNYIENDEKRGINGIK
jgi:hypothetical protein